MTVDERLDAGWRPSLSIARLWVLGRKVIRGRDGDILAESWDRSEPMTEAEEQELMVMVWSDR